MAGRPRAEAGPGGRPIGIVTGSDSGIGKATAVALAEAGYDVGVTWHTDDAGAKGTADEVVGITEPFLDVKLESWRHVLDVDLTGPMLCAQRAARRMVAAGRGGRIVNVTSVHEHVPLEGSSAYCAAKGGLGQPLGRRRGGEHLPYDVNKERSHGRQHR